jgi:hypothetical protein
MVVATTSWLEVKLSAKITPVLVLADDGGIFASLPC